MTARALIIGLIGAMFIAGFGYINDQVFGFESFTSGHLLPIIVVGLMFITMIILNPLLFRARRSWLLRPAEMTLVVVLMMGAHVLRAGVQRYLIDLMERGAVDLSATEVVVLDEADQMADMGFLPDIKRIIRQVPERSFDSGTN